MARWSDASLLPQPPGNTLLGLRRVMAVAWGQVTDSHVGNVSRFYSVCPDEVARFLEGRLLNFGFWTAGCARQQDAASEMVEQLARLAEIEPGQSVLDVGCGFGEAALKIHEEYGAGEVVGVNVTPCQLDYAAESARRRGASGAVRFVNADATALPFENCRFDHVMALESAFHFSPRDTFFKEAWRVLRPGGHLTIADVVPKRNDAGRIQKLLAARLWLVPRANNYDPDEYQKRLVQIGFSDVEYHSIQQQVYGPYVQWTLQPANVKRLRALLGWSRAQVYIWQTQLLGWLADRDLLDYALLRAVKPSA